MRSSSSVIRLKGQSGAAGAVFACKRVYSVPMSSPLTISFADSIKQAQRRTFYDQHQLLAVSMILIVLILPFVGLLVSGLFGVIAGALVSFAAYYLAPYVLLKLGV